MPMSQGNFSSGPPGLSLKAWVLANPTTGAIQKSSGLSAFVRNAAGQYTATFSSAMQSTNYVVTWETARGSAFSGVQIMQTSGMTVNSCGVFFAFDGNPTGYTDPSFLFIAFFE